MRCFFFISSSFLLLALAACSERSAVPCADCGSGDADTEDVEDLVPPDAAAPDAAPVCPKTTHECLSLVPEGWSGPALRADQDMGEETPACPSGYDDAGVFSWDINAEGACDCECGTAVSLACRPARVTGKYTNDPAGWAPCTGLCTSCESVEINPNTCRSIGSLNAYPRLEVRLGNVVNGNCSDGSITSDFSASFQQQVSLCSAPSESLLTGCEESEVCAPKNANSFRNQCIYKAGEQLCPESIFSERLVVFEDIQDERSCSACSCTPDLSQKCGSSLLMSVLDQTCSSATPEPLAGCVDGNRGGATVYYDVDPSTHQCKLATPPAVVGEAVATGALTICCAP